MVATVRNLTSSSATSEYFRRDGGYYLSPGDDQAALRAKQDEHRNASAWHGRGAQALGLDPGRRVAAGAFEKLLQGHVIGTGTRLGRRRDGQHEHRPGFDITFSAPKSVSLAALLPTEKHPRGDRAVIRAHDQAVRATLDWIEGTMLETRGWEPATGRRPRIKAPSMVAATFRHIASRNLDPQLHTHAVVANMTRDAGGRWKSVEPTLLHRNARLIGAYYRNELSRRLIERGYSILPAMVGRMPSFEIAGYSRELRETFSTRRREILAFMEDRGWEHGHAAAQAATLATRKRKAEPLRATLQTAWADRAREAGLDAVPSVSRSAEPIVLPEAPSAVEIVGRAMRHLEERRSVFAEQELEALALGHSPGRHSIGAIRDAVAWMVRDGHLVEAELSRADRAFVTDRALKAERSVIAMMKAGIGAGEALGREAEMAAHLAGAGLTEGQEAAVRTVLLAPDRVVGVQGRAGTGKTAMLRQVRELAGDRPVLGLAPSAASARVLQRETDMNVRTLQWFLARCRRAAGENGPAIEELKERFGDAVLVLDEASMVSTDQMRSLMRIADELDVARLVLVGDRGQLRAVEAGQPFRLLQQAGMTTARMDDIRRQRSPELREAVLAVLAGDPGEAVELLGSSVHEVACEELGEKAARAWLELGPDERERTLLVAPTHEIRAEINETVRETLAEEGALSGKALRIERLVSLGMTRAEKGDVRNYREGDTVVFHQDLVNYRLKKDEILTVTGIDYDRVMLLHPDGKPRGIRPAGSVRYRLDVYETRPIEIRAGDRIRWTRNDKARSLINGERAEVTGIAGNRVRFRVADGRVISLRADDPQLRHIDHAWSSTVHGAQGSTADGVIAVLDSSHGALTDQSIFYVELSRARDRAVVLTDNAEQLVEVLEANTGERATALEAVGERIGPDEDELAHLLAEKAPVWSPREEWAALEERARLEGTVLFRVDGYEALIERARKLALLPDLPAETREVTDGLLAYDRACREQGAAASEFLGLLDAHAAERNALERAAEAGGSAIAGIEGYAGWRERAGRLSANGTVLLAEHGGRAGEDGARIAERLDRLSGLLALDDEVLAFETLRLEVNARAAAAGTAPYRAEGHDGLVERARALAGFAELPAHMREAAEEVIADAGIGALFDETDRLVDERRGLEERAAGTPPTELGDYAAWSALCEATGRQWRAMLDDPGTWRAHLDRLGDEARRIARAVDRLAELRGHDRAWASLFDMRRELWEQAKAGNVIAFYVAGWEPFVQEARGFAKRQGLPRTAAQAAERVLRYDRGCRKARAAVENFLEDSREHRKRWDALAEEAAGRRARDPDISIADLPGYRPLSEFAREVRRAGERIRRHPNTYAPHLDRVPDGRESFAATLELLERHGPLDRFVEVTGRLRETARNALEREILPFHDEAHGAAIADARRLAREPGLEEAARRRLEAALEAHAARAAEWLEIDGLLRAADELEREYRRIEERAAREGLPRSLLPEWRGWQEQNRRFVEDASWVLHDDGLLEHRNSRPDVFDRIEDGLRRARGRERVPELEADRIAEMVGAELARLRGSHAGHDFGREWWGGEPLVAGDRLRLRWGPDGSEREAVLRHPGRSGGCAPEDVLTLEWVGAAPEHAPDEPVHRVASLDLAGRGVRRAEWSDERLRDAELARLWPGPPAAFTLDCERDLAVGDRVRWTEILAPEPGASRDDRPAYPGRAAVVHFEGELVGRTADTDEKKDLCRVDVRWRSDGAPCEQIDLPFDMLVAGGLWRAFWDDEAEREREAREQERKLDERREILLRPGPNMSMRIG